MKFIGRVIWKGALAPPTWFAVVSVLNSALAIIRIWVGARTVFDAPITETMLSLSCIAATAYFWRNPMPTPKFLIAAKQRHSGC